MRKITRIRSAPRIVSIGPLGEKTQEQGPHVNARLELIARAIEADERGEDGITPTPRAIRVLKVKL